MAKRKHICNGVLVIIGGCIWMTYLGSQFIVSLLSPYIQSYYNVSAEETQILLPLMNTISMPCVVLGSQLTQNHFNPRLQLAIGGLIGIGGCFAAGSAKSYPVFLILFPATFGFEVHHMFIISLCCFPSGVVSLVCRSSSVFINLLCSPFIVIAISSNILIL